ncbi:MAG: AAA family ATPase, partial [Thermodesulfovibrionia bacterium]|nr:AAA family ATPase [Thermodesulfovibrionia bacterium]
VASYLDKLSEDYEKQSKYNVEYLYNKSIDHIRRRDLENLADGIKLELDRNREDRASEKLVDFQLIHKETSKVFNPLEEKYIDEKFEGEVTGILELPDALGQLIGPLDRGWLVSFTAPEKRGKTWWLIEMAFQALVQKLNVLFVSLEMPEKDIRQRMWKRMTAGDKRAKAVLPVLDCKLNQDDSCEEFDLRENEIRLLNDSGDGKDKKPSFKDRAVNKYKTCIECKGKRKFQAGFWYERIRVNEYSKEKLLDKAKDIRKQYGDSLRVKCYPAYTANLRDVKALHEELEVNEGFIADVLITDYLDIFAPESGVNLGRESIDTTWKMGKSIAQMKNLLHITVDQSSKITYEKDIRLYDTSEDKRKNAHLDVKVAMNAVPEEVEDDVSVLKFAVIAHRHRTFKPYNQVLVLQQTNIGQPLLDCAWIKK